MAFLSESKYGFACEGNVLRISLLRAATAPDAEQDQGLLFCYDAKESQLILLLLIQENMNSPGQ